MAIPVYLQQFKAAGIYRVVFDKSTVQGVDSEILRLVVGYSEKGPFNIPTYVTSASDFRAIYGDISKKLEKRGIFFHRLAIQALSAGPILALNLKKFDGETVDGATINTNFNPSFEPIDTVKINVEDIYDTSRFWELSAEKLNNLRSVSGSVMDQYINICATNTKDCSGTYIIRKAAGQKVSGYNLTISDWYSDGSVELPEYLEPYKNSLVSDFFAEIYVFKGRFIASQVLASSTLKNYFEVEVDPITGKPKTDDEGKYVSGLKVTFKINGVSIRSVSNSNGFASVKINLKAGKYKITASYHGKTVKNNIVVKPTLTAKNIKVKKGKTIKFNAKLVDIKGKALKNKKITFKIKGKSYKVKTNKKGIATLKLKLKLKVGKHTVKTSYGKNIIKNTIFIKR